MQDWDTWAIILIVIAGAIIIAGIVYFLVRYFRNRNKK